MKTFFYFFLLLILSSCAEKQENILFTSGFEENISSKILGEERKVWIHVPFMNRDNKTADKERYPVIYLLDGDYNFNTVVSITEHMSQEGLCPPIIVVGILNPNRMLDLTTGTDPNFPKDIGRGEKFLSYIEKELIPYIDKKYPTAPHKTFIGHSLGGLAVVNALMHKPDIFNAYISIEGALWWNNNEIVEESKIALANKDFENKRLFIALANRMERGIDTVLVQKDTSNDTNLIRSNLKFIKEISKNKKNHLQFKHKYYGDDNHSSVRLIAEYDALRFIFDYYKLNIYNSEIDNPNFKLDSLVKQHYKNVSKQMGYAVKPDEFQINNLAYQIMSRKQLDKAEYLFKLNIANYPKKANTYDSMGDLYLAKGDSSKAMENFKKALSIEENPISREKLDMLLKKTNK